MRIAIAPFAAPFVELFINLAKHLQRHNHEVLFLEADPYVCRLLRKEGQDCTSYREVNFTEEYYTETSRLVQQYCRLHHVKNVAKVAAQKNKDFARAKNFFKEFAVDKILIFNGEMNVESDVCSALGIESLFFENGYFPETFQVNKKGVNARSEYAQLSFSDFMQFHFAKAEISKVEIPIVPIKHSIALRYFFRFFDANYRGIMFHALRGNRAKKIAQKNFRNASTDDFDPNQLTKWAFFPLQVNSDTQIVLNSAYESMREVLQVNLAKLLNAGYQVVLKEHPEEVEPVDYSDFVDNKNVFLLKKFDINRLIAASDFTITVNSSVGLQAVEHGKPVVILGESFYRSAPNVSFLEKTQSDLHIPRDYSANDVSRYVSHFKEEIFIAGSWRKLNSAFLTSLCARILAENEEN